MIRDFTYIDDIVAGFVSAIDLDRKFEIINLGCGKPVELMRFIDLIEQEIGKTSQKKLLPLQPGDVPATYADVEALTKLIQFSPSTSIENGVAKFVQWYRAYHSHNVKKGAA